MALPPGRDSSIANAALAQSATGNLNQFIDPLKSGLNLITNFGFIAGCVMVMSGFLNTRGDELYSSNPSRNRR